VDSSPVSSTSGIVTFDQQEGRPLTSSEHVTSPLDNVADSCASFRSPLLQQMMVTRAKSQLPEETSKESSIERADSTESPELPASHLNYNKQSSFIDNTRCIEYESPQHNTVTYSSSSVSTIQETSSDLISHPPESFITNSELIYRDAMHLQAVDSNSAVAEASRWSSDLDTFLSETSNAVTSYLSSSSASASDTNLFNLVPALVADDKLHNCTNQEKSNDYLVTHISTNIDNCDDSTDGCYKERELDNTNVKGEDTDDKLVPKDLVNINMLSNEVKKSEYFGSSETMLVAGDNTDLFGLPDNQSINGYGKLSPDEEKSVLYKLPQMSSIEESQIRSRDIYTSNIVETMSQKLTVIDDEANKLMTATHKNPTCTFDPSHTDVKSSTYLFDVNEEVHPVEWLKKSDTNYSNDAFETIADTRSFVTNVHSAPVGLSNVNDELSANTSCFSVPHCVDGLLHQTVIPMSEMDYVNPITSSSNHNESCHRDMDDADVCYPILSNEDGVLLHMLPQPVDAKHSVNSSKLNVEEGSSILAPSMLINCSKNEGCNFTAMSVAHHCQVDMCTADIKASEDEEKCLGHSAALHSVHEDSITLKSVDQCFSDLFLPDSSSENCADQIDMTSTALVKNIPSDKAEYSNNNRGAIHSEPEVAREKSPRYLELNAADLIEGVYRSRASDTDSMLISNNDIPSRQWTNSSICEELSAMTTDISSFRLESEPGKSSDVDVLSVDTRKSDTIEDMEIPDVAMPSDEDTDISVADVPDCLLG